MNFELKGESRSFTIKDEEWSQALMLAMRFGWKPEGTTSAALDENWNGTYFSAEGQRAGDEDARTLAGAVEKALDDVPDEPPGDEKAQPGKLNSTLRSEHYFGGPEHKAMLGELITFLRGGWFTISPA